MQFAFILNNSFEKKELTIESRHVNKEETTNTENLS